jgi:hypothetical protein
MDFPTEGARIACPICGARPFAADWGLPSDLDCFDLIKVGDKWGCPKHRAPRSRLVASDRTESEAETLLGELADLIARMDVQIDEGEAAIDEEQRAQALDLVSRIGALVGRLRKKAAA